MPFKGGSLPSIDGGANNKSHHGEESFSNDDFDYSDRPIDREEQFDYPQDGDSYDEYFEQAIRESRNLPSKRTKSTRSKKSKHHYNDVKSSLSTSGSPTLETGDVFCGSCLLRDISRIKMKQSCRNLTRSERFARINYSYYYSLHKTKGRIRTKKYYRVFRKEGQVLNLLSTSEPPKVLSNRRDYRVVRYIFYRILPRLFITLVEPHDNCVVWELLAQYSFLLDHYRGRKIGDDSQGYHLGNLGILNYKSSLDS